MNSASKLMKNTLLLAASTVGLRMCGLCFQAYLAAQVGAKELGVFGIISSVGVVFATIAISGVRFSVTRLVSEEEGVGNSYPHSLMRCAFFYAIIFGGISGLTLYFSAQVLSEYWVMNSSAALALRIMAVSMPLIALGGAAEGYFTAKQKIFRLVCMEMSAQILRIVFVMLCFNMARKLRVMNVLSAGMLVSEAFLAIGMLILYAVEMLGKREKFPRRKNFTRLVKTAMPLAISAYMRTGLSSLGQVIIPRGLRRSGMGSEAAFSTYGIITQMSMPVVMFPAALLSALGEILVPRLTSAQVMGQKLGISYIVNRALRIGVIFSFCVAGVMFAYAPMLGQSVYNSAQAGFYIRIFAPLVPIIYIDCVTDGCLKGLGQQVHSMVYNVLEGIINVTLLTFLLPKAAITAYIAVMYIKEVFNAVLSLRRLSKVTAVELNLMMMVSVAISAWGATVFGEIIAPGASVVWAIALYCILFVALLYVSSAVSRDDLKWIVSLMHNEEKTIKNKTKKALPGVDKKALQR